MKKTPQISVCIPMYNAAQYIGECLDSVLSQTFTDYEVVVIDDGSTDASCAIVETYHDERIRLVRKEHNYIATINSLFEEARGKYVARMDADDVMYPHRLQVQFEFMESHPDVDILGSGMSILGKDEVMPPPCINNVGVSDFLENFCVFNPTSFLRTSSVRAVKLKYDADYIYSEDYHFWAQAVCKGLKILNISEPLVKYRISDAQVSYTKSVEQWHSSLKVRSYLMANWNRKLEGLTVEVSQNEDSSNELTIVIPFYNEGEELRATVKSIRETAGYEVDIVVVNDCSDDAYDYQGDLQPYNVRMVENKERIGASASKSYGISFVCTPYFILLDAHMRFYDKSWHRKLITELKKDANRMLCCQTRFLDKDDNGVITERSSSVYGAFIDFYTPETIPAAKWNYLYTEIGDCYPLPIPAVLGATYASSKKYWNKLKGFSGLIGYGFEEEYISIKAWLEGGGCHLLYDIEVGHIYRRSSRYENMGCQYAYNRLMIAEVLLPFKMRCKVHASVVYRNSQNYFYARAMLKGVNKNVLALRDYYQESLKGNDILKVLAINNVTQLDIIKDLKERLAELPSIIAFAMSAEYTSCGLFDGKMSVLLLLCLKNKLYGSTVTEKKFIDALSLELCDSSLVDKMPCEFRNGFVGLGWALMYLCDHGFINYDVAKRTLLKIDQKLQCYNVAEWNDLSLDSGAYGIIVYVAARLMFCKHHVSSYISPFSDSFMLQIKKVANQMFNMGQTRIRVLANILLIKDFDSHEHLKYMPCELSDWASLPKYLPNNSKYWTVGLNGATGYAIRMLSTYIKLTKK